MIRFWFFVVLGLLGFVIVFPGVLAMAVARLINELTPLISVAIFAAVVMFFLSLFRGSSGGGKKTK